MTAFNPTSAVPEPVILRLAPAIYGITLFFSALLLFAVQPMFTKMVLPQLGGAPTVWSVAMVFFQAALLFGYAYAHLIVRRLPLGLGALVHLAVLALAAATLPISIAHGFGAAPTEGIAPWLIALFTASIGLPFMALAASAPLLQGWFAASGHVAARNPYVLYAGSNLGSFAALLAYPFAVEPYLTLKEQAQVWAMGFALLAVLVAIASLLVARRPSLGMADATGLATPSWQARLVWVALAAVPVGLVIAVTSYITTDIASAPFLWVLPLALYLLTFVAVFRDPPWPTREIVANLVPIPVAVLAVSLLSGERQYWLVAVVVNLVALLLLALLCHGELYRRRPEPAFLTDFYLCLSLGGVLGGVFAALIAPQLFTLVYEYPILIIAALLVLPGMLAADRKRILSESGPALAIAVLAIWARFWTDIRVPVWAATWFQVALVALVALMLLQRHRPQRFLALVVLGFVLTGLWQPGFNRIAAIRSFFGVNQVVDTADGRFRLLYHGTTVHGGERVADIGTADIGTNAGAKPEPLTYFYPGGPFSEGIEAVRAARGHLRRVAVAGLGAGSLACYKRNDEQWTFFEIDSAVARIARDPRFFTYISACAPDVPVVLGDARLTLAGSARQYGLIILDVFSSDAIPVHLLTREALNGYLARLDNAGAVLIHITNKYMELGSVVAAMASAEGLVAYHKLDDRPAAVPFDYKANASVAALARRRSDLGDLPDRPGWHELKPVPGVSAWTDDYSNILGAIFRKRFGS
jgi:hypothetical protein